MTQAQEHRTARGRVQEFVSRTFLAEHLGRLRALASPVAAVVLFGIMGLWTWQNRQLVWQTFVDLGLLRLGVIAIVLTIVFVLSAVVFTSIARSMGYPLSFVTGYNYLNISQIGAMLPGKVWGFAGLAGLLWTSGVSKRDSGLIIFLNLVLMLSACAIVGLAGLQPIFGAIGVTLSVAPILVLILGREQLDKLRGHVLPGTSHLPSTRALLGFMALGILKWLLLAGCFVLPVLAAVPESNVSLLLAASAYPAGYIAGFLSLIAPSGLGVSEGVTALILQPHIGMEQALAAAIAFRIILTTIQWLNIGISLILVNLPSRKTA